MSKHQLPGDEITLKRRERKKKGEVYDRHHDLLSHPNGSNSLESIFCQFLSLHMYPGSMYLCSSSHSGIGQIPYGTDKRQKADIMIVDPPQELGGAVTHHFRNFDGLFFHAFGHHLADCAKRQTWGKGEIPVREFSVMEKAEKGNRFVNTAKMSRSMSTFYRKALEAENHESDDDTDYTPALDVPGNSSACSEQALTHENWYGTYDKSALAMSSSELEHWYGYHTKTSQMSILTGVRTEEARMHRLRREYANAMSGVRPRHLKITYDSIHECTFFHDHENAEASFGMKRRLAAINSESKTYLRHGNTTEEEEMTWRAQEMLQATWDPKSWLERFYCEDFVGGFDRRNFTQTELVDTIMKEGSNFVHGNEFGGVVCISGGREGHDRDVGMEGSFGFCTQRTKLETSDLGPFTRYQARLYCGGDKKKSMNYLDRLVDKEMTISRHSFHEKGETISLDMMRFLIARRRFSGFKILHVVLYRNKKFLSPFLDKLLQYRHELKRLGKGLELKSNLAKLLLNSMYGK